MANDEVSTIAPPCCEIVGCGRPAVAIYFPVYSKPEGGWRFIDDQKSGMILCDFHLPGPAINAGTPPTNLLM